MNNRGGHGEVLLLLKVLLSLALMPAGQVFAGRDPFQPPPVVNEGSTVGPPIRGMVSDGVRRHDWTMDADGRWRRREPPDDAVGKQPPSPSARRLPPSTGAQTSPSASSMQNIRTMAGQPPGP